MTDAPRLALYDGILVTETDRLARLDDKGWHDIESWCYDNGKCIVTGEGVRFPAREGNDGDYWQWHALKKQARRYLEQTAAKHAGGRAIAQANGGFIGAVPFGYAISGAKYRKALTPHPENGPLVVEIFTRIATGQSGATVAAWLSAATGRKANAEKYSRSGPVRVKFILDLVRNPVYRTGERDGAEFEPLISAELWNDANSTIAARSFTRTAMPSVHGYSGVIYCPCGTVLYRHQSDRGAEKYRCGRGRRGVPEQRCGLPGLGFDAVNARVDEVMSALQIPEQVQRAEGGDAGKAAELLAIKRRMTAAVAANDMPEVARLSVAYSEREARQAAPVRVWWEQTGRSLGELWQAGDLAARRALLTEGIGAHGYRMVVSEGERAELVLGPDDED
jgi:DNA invertase Pin-like site-specific DNA recombinase